MGESVLNPHVSGPSGGLGIQLMDIELSMITKNQGLTWTWASTGWAENEIRERISMQLSDKPLLDMLAPLLSSGTSYRTAAIIGYYSTYYGT